MTFLQLPVQCGQGTMSVRFGVITAILGNGQLQAFPLARVNSCEWCPYVAVNLQPHEAWLV